MAERLWGLVERGRLLLCLRGSFASRAGATLSLTRHMLILGLRFNNGSSWYELCFPRSVNAVAMECSLIPREQGSPAGEAALAVLPLPKPRFPLCVAAPIFILVRTDNQRTPDVQAPGA